MDKEQLITKVGELLGIAEPQKMDLKTLYLHLKQYWATLHPDKNTESSDKAELEEKFKEIGPIIDQFETLLQKTPQSRLPAKVTKKDLARTEDIFSEIALRQKDNQILKMKSEIDTKSKNLDTLQQQLASARKEITSATEKVARKGAPASSVASKLSLGVAAILALLSTLNTNLFGLLNNLQTQGVLPPNLLPIIFWILFLVLGFSIIRKQFRQWRVNSLLDKIYTAEVRKEFCAQLSDRYFDEAFIVEFVKQKNQPAFSRIRPLYLLRSFFINSITPSDYDRLARAFIAKMEEDNLIEYEGASKFQRTYSAVENVDKLSWFRK